MTTPCIQEIRIARLEAEQAGSNSEIKNLVKRLDNLIKCIWALLLVLTPSLLGLFGFLVWQVIMLKGGN